MDAEGCGDGLLDSKYDILNGLLVIPVGHTSQLQSDGGESSSNVRLRNGQRPSLTVTKAPPKVLLLVISGANLGMLMAMYFDYRRVEIINRVVNEEW